jgi:DNA-binding NtrC family response regulator
MNNKPSSRGTLLSIIELGGYPNFAPLYLEAGFEVLAVRSLRKALAAMKKTHPKVIVAEFNYQSDFRDRTSNLESLLAAVQRRPKTKVIVFYESQYLHQFERVRSRFSIYAALSYPIDADALRAHLKAIPD